MTGTRTYRLLPDSLRLLWEEHYDGPAQSGHGVLWYHPASQKFYAFDVVAPSNEASLLSGSLQPGDTAIVFDLVSVNEESIPVNRGMVRSRLVVPRSGDHTWSRWDNAWVVTFRRQ